jgi:hypothetical protein
MAIPRLCWKLESYSSVKGRLLNDPKWSSLLLRSLEKKISPRTIASYLAEVFVWADKSSLVIAIEDNKLGLERVKDKVGPVQYMRYLDEVFTHLLMACKKEEKYLPRPITTTLNSSNKIVIAMLLEDWYDQTPTILNIKNDNDRPQQNRHRVRKRQRVHAQPASSIH